MNDYELHPEAYTDLWEISEYIGDTASTQLSALPQRSLKQFSPSCLFRAKATGGPTLLRAHCVFGVSMII
jgi:hypothetical protein